jgi:hypothetical protein
METSEFDVMLTELEQELEAMAPSKDEGRDSLVVLFTLHSELEKSRVLILHLGSCFSSLHVLVPYCV